MDRLTKSDEDGWRRNFEKTGEKAQSKTGVLLVVSRIRE